MTDEMNCEGLQADVDSIEQSIGLDGDNVTFAAKIASFIMKYKLATKALVDWLLDNDYITDLEEAQKQYNENGSRNSVYYVNSEKVKTIDCEDNNKQYVLKNQWSSQKEKRQRDLAQHIYDLVKVRPSAARNPQKGKNLIIYGAPGTGKSYHVEHEMGLDKDKITRVVFHPEYTYFDFVGQYRPCPIYAQYPEGNQRSFVTAGGGSAEIGGEPFIDYRFVPGPFTDVLVKARKDQEHMYTLLIEELNRADAAAVFGDVFQLLDRDSEGNSEYGIVPSEEWGAYLKSAEVTLPEGKVKIPSNMNIIATMNSADQGVHVLDTAFKRRWDYHFMSIDEGLNSEELKDIKVRYAGTDIDWKQFITILNEKLADDFQIPEDRLIGPFFVKPKIVKEDSEKAIKKILFYLWDDVLRNSSGRNQFFKGITTMSQLYKDFDKGEDVMGIKDKLGSNTENSGQA